jgi:phosphoribosylformylglycinamidine cyclo-ligase
MPATYRDAGVDLDIYAESMGRLPALMHRTFSPRVVRNDGGFAGLFRLDFDGKLFARNYKEPILVSGTDGVGTKLKVAQQTGRHATVGIDLVGMCVNDLLCTGAEPLFFLDYVAMGRDDPDRLEQIVRGISDGCVAADCSLLGGETAIMPDMYAKDDYDLAGFAVGVVDRERLIDGKAINLGDRVIGLASNGLHSNGFSLVRKIIRDSGIDFDSHNASLGGNVADELLRPTRLYVEAVREIQSHYRVKQVIHGIAHITGGGIEENLDRILPKSMDARVQEGSWPVPRVFTWLQELGEVEHHEMRRVFNMGIGLTVVVSPYYAASVMNQLQSIGIECFDIGEIVPGTGKVQMIGQ